MSKVALPMVGIFDTTLGRLVGISPEGATDVTTVATVETNQVTGRIRNSIGGRMYGDVFALGKTAVLFGDSLTLYNSAIVSGRVATKQTGYWAMAMAMLGDRQMDFVVNAGIGGNTTTDMLTRIATDVLAYPSDVVFVMGGTNDITAATPVATITANLKQIYSRIVASGRTVVALYCPGFGPASGTREAYNAVASAINAWIATQETAGLVIAVDTYTAMQESAANWADDKHPTTIGAREMGKAIAEEVGLLIPENITQKNNLLSNGLFYGSGTNWTTGGASGGSVGTLTYAESTIGYSCDAPVTFTDGTSSAYLRGEALHTLITPGEYVWLEADVTIIDGTSLAGVRAQMQYQIDSVSTASSAMYQGTIQALEVGKKYRFRTIPAQLSGTSITICRPEFWAYGSAAGTAKFRVENVKVFKRA